MSVILMVLVAIATLQAISRVSNQASPESPASQSVVLGRVIDATSGQPIAFAVVQMVYVGAAPSPSTALPAPAGAQQSQTAPRVIVTDPAGRFMFYEVNAGRYRMIAHAPGYTSSGYRQDSIDDTQVHYLDLSANFGRLEADLRLWRFAAITGIVLDEAREPAVGVVVKAWRRVTAGASRGRLLIGGWGSSDDRGTYRISGLRPGSYVVGITAEISTLSIDEARANLALAAKIAEDRLIDPLAKEPILSGVQIGSQIVDVAPETTGYVLPPPGQAGNTRVYQTTFFPAAGAVSQAQIVSLAPGEERPGINLALDLVTGVRVSGSVIGSTGPVGKVTVSIHSPDASQFVGPSDMQVATTSADATGSFKLLGVPAGQYLLVATTAEGSQGDVGVTPNSAARAEVPISVGRDDINGFEVRLQPGVRLSGHLEFVDGDSRPSPAQLAHLAVTLISLDRAGPVNVARPTSDGQFTLAGLSPGKYLADVRLAGLPASWTLLAAMLDGHDIADAPLEIHDSDIAGLVVTLSGRSAVLKGVISDTSGKVDTAAVAIVFSADSQGWRSGVFNPRRDRLVAADASGAYEFRNLPAGEYFVVALKSAAAKDWETADFLVNLSQRSIRVTLGPGDRRTVPLRTSSDR